MKAQYGDHRPHIGYEEDNLKKVVAKGVEGNPLRRCEKYEDGRQHPHPRGHHASPSAPPNDARRHAHSYHCTRLSPSYAGRTVTVAGVGAGPRQNCQSKTTNPIATTLSTTPLSKLACAKSGPADQSPPIVMVPWAAWDTSVMSTLPPVRLNNHVYQNVTARVPSRKPTMIDGCKPPSSRKRMGTCQPVTSAPRMRVDTSGERVLCSPGRATPRQPGSSPSAPSPGLIRRMANIMRTVVTEPIPASEGTLAPRA